MLRWKVNYQIQAVLSAANFAAQKHVGQRRKGAAAEPYLNHLIEVAYLVSTTLIEPDPEVVIGALLHDVIEDAGVSAAELSHRFGENVSDLVMELTDEKSLPKDERKRLQIEHAPKLSVRAQTIKLADKVSNLRSLLIGPPAEWSQERIAEYVVWATRVVDRLTAPNPLLMAEFEETVKRFNQVAN